MKDENKLDELLEVLRYYHSSVPKTSDNELNLKLCFGQEVSHSWPLLKVQKNSATIYVPMLCEKKTGFEVC